jgi:hypothetical protein
MRQRDRFEESVNPEKGIFTKKEATATTPLLGDAAENANDQMNDSNCYRAD